MSHSTQKIQHLFSDGKRLTFLFFPFFAFPPFALPTSFPFCSQSFDFTLNRWFTFLHQTVFGRVMMKNAATDAADLPSMFVCRSLMSQRPLRCDDELWLWVIKCSENIGSMRCEGKKKNLILMICLILTGSKLATQHLGFLWSLKIIKDEMKLFIKLIEAWWFQRTPHYAELPLLSLHLCLYLLLIMY